MSIRTTAQIGTALHPLIKPDNLKIEGWFATSHFEPGVLLLPTSEIREVSRLGVAVNDQEALTDPDDLVRLQETIALHFVLLGKKVEDETGHTLGRVDDYAVDLDSYYVERIYVAPPSLRFFHRKQLIVARSQIVEITDKKIVVRSGLVPEKSLFKAPLPEAEG